MKIMYEKPTVNVTLKDKMLPPKLETIQEFALPSFVFKIVHEMLISYIRQER